jgi:hypothetical protein
MRESRTIEASQQRSLPLFGKNGKERKAYVDIELFRAHKRSHDLGKDVDTSDLNFGWGGAIGGKGVFGKLRDRDGGVCEIGRVDVST